MHASVKSTSEGKLERAVERKLGCIAEAAGDEGRDMDVAEVCGQVT